MHKGARTVLCGGRSVMVVPTASSTLRRKSGLIRRISPASDLPVTIRFALWRKFSQLPG